MRKLILVGLATFVIIGVAALGISWFERASVAKDAVKSYLASLNTADSKITYETINASGFPAYMNISVINPHFTGRIDKLLANNNLDKSFKIEIPPEWSEDFSLNGSIDFSVNIFSNKFKVSQHGNLVTKGNIAGKIITISSESSGSNACDLQLKKSGGMFDNLWDFYSFFNNKNASIRDFRSFDCVFPSGKVINNETKEQLITYDKSFVSIGYTPHADLSDIRFNLKLSDFKLTKAYDEVFTVYQKLLFPNETLPLPSVYGKQNIEIDILYNGTENWQSLEVRNLPFDFKINKFLVSNEAYSFNMNAKANNNVKGDERNTSLYYKSETTVTKLLNALLKAQLFTIKDSVVSGNIQANPEIKNNLSNITPEELDKLISSVIPDFAALGKMVTEIDFNYSGSKDFGSGQTNLKSLEFSFAPYGITANASATRAKDGGSISGNASLSCRNCLNMIDDIMGYFERVRSAVSVLSPKTTENIKVSPRLAQAMKDFLVAVASKDKDTLKFDLINDGAGKITLNGKNNVELMELFGKIIAPELNNKQ